MSKCPVSGYAPNSGKCSCRHCLSERARWQREYRQKNPSRLRRANLKKYGLSLEEYHERLEEQGGVCAVCDKPELDSNQHSKMSLAVDHNHTTGEIRGLLCHRCNRALGLLGDNTNTVSALLDYRRKYG